jgi:hypothetical protein
MNRPLYATNADIILRSLIVIIFSVILPFSATVNAVSAAVLVQELVSSGSVRSVSEEIIHFGIAGQASPLGAISDSGGDVLSSGSLVMSSGIGMRSDQTITFYQPAEKTFGDNDFNLIATASSGLTVAFSSSDEKVATVNGSTVTITGVGTAIITAMQTGNGAYNPAPEVQQTLTVKENPDLDSDGDGIPDVEDAFQDDPNEQKDSDEDGTGDNADTDDDNDGISDEEENAGPGSGDANGDQVLDSLQSNVVSLRANGSENYVILESTAGTTLSHCEAADNPSPDDAPADVYFLYGFFKFTISGISQGETTLTLYLPAGANPGTYYKYGKTPDNQTDHWYEFLLDAGETGAVIDENVITLYFVDAEKGDDILIPDNMVVDLGGPGFYNPYGGGRATGCFINSLSP